MSSVKRFLKAFLLLWLVAFLILEVIVFVHLPSHQIKRQGYWTAMVENTQLLLDTGSLKKVEKEIPKAEVIVE